LHKFQSSNVPDVSPSPTSPRGFASSFRRLPDLEITGPPERLRSNFIHGIKRMPCAGIHRHR
jgi:hypothetical protein